MTVFEYLSVLVSIVLALGIAKVLGGLSSIARAWKHVTPYWVHLAWVFLILVLHVQIWWAFWDFSGERTWTLANFTAMLVIPGTAYFLAHLVTPDAAASSDIDLRAHFADIRVPFFLVLSFFWAYAMVWRTVAFGDPLFAPRRVAQASLAILAIAGAAKEGHRWQVGVLVTSVFAWVALLWLRLGLGLGID